MGVRGLTTYISNHHRKYLKNYKLHGCYIIIDGNSLACQLYVKFISKAHVAFGGDYNHYAQNVKQFFSLLNQCEVKAIVIFDGGYETRKVKTVLRRISDRLAAVKHVKPGCQNSAIIFPLLLRMVFREVLKEINVPFVQCDFEADQEIASLANKYNCPILSYDSDFYIYDVNYIPFTTLEFTASAFNFELGEQLSKYYVNCKLYKISYFLDSFGGLDKSMLPLLASLLGNDYIKISVFRKFYSQLKIPKGKSNRLQRRIARVIQWLRNETFESAVQRILGRMKRMRHRSVTESIKRVVNAYTNCEITVEQYLPTEFTNMVKGKVDTSSNNVATTDYTILDQNFSENLVQQMDEENVMNPIDEDDELSSESDTDGDDCLNKINSDINEMDIDTPEENVCDEKEFTKKITNKISPVWLCESSRKGNIEPCITDILTLRKYFALPQVEDLFYKNSHLINIPLLKIICSLLTYDKFKNISLWMRNDNCKIQRFLLHYNDIEKIAEISDIPHLPIDKRKYILLQCLGIPNEFDLDTFPDEWKLYMCTVIFWLKNATQIQVTRAHVVSLCMSIVALSLIECKVGVFKKKMDFFKKHGKTYKKLIKIRAKECDNEKIVQEHDEEYKDKNISDVNLNEHFTSYSVNQMVKSITYDDCLMVFESFYPYHQIDKDLRMDKRTFSFEDIHLFAQFQSCLYHIMLLNSLLEFPFEYPAISYLYSGTFIYNMCVAIKKCKNVSSFIEMHLRYSPKISSLLNKICFLLYDIVNVPDYTQQTAKKTRRRKRNRNRRSKTVKSDDSEEEKSETTTVRDCSNDVYCDENNAFAILSSL